MKTATIILFMLLNVTPVLAIGECPAGFTYNNEGGYCEALPGCAPGFALDSEDPLCVAAADPQKRCPDGSSYQAGKNRCEAKLTCPDGSLFDPNIEKCMIKK